MDELKKRHAEALGKYMAMRLMGGEAKKELEEVRRLEKEIEYGKEKDY